jgi:glutathione S-transferase
VPTASMDLVYLVIILALIEYQVFGALVGRARATYGVKAPAVTGPEEFERVFRVHQNSLECLVIFLPAVWLFGRYLSPLWAAVLGVVFIIGRAVYARGYIAAAEKRGPGAGITGITCIILSIGALVGVIMALL